MLLPSLWWILCSFWFHWCETLLMYLNSLENWIFPTLFSSMLDDAKVNSRNSQSIISQGPIGFYARSTWLLGFRALILKLDFSLVVYHNFRFLGDSFSLRIFPNKAKFVNCVSCFRGRLQPLQFSCCFHQINTYVHVRLYKLECLPYIFQCGAMKLLFLNK